MAAIYRIPIVYIWLPRFTTMTVLIYDIVNTNIFTMHEFYVCFAIYRTILFNTPAKLSIPNLTHAVVKVGGIDNKFMSQPTNPC